MFRRTYPNQAVAPRFAVELEQATEPPNPYAPISHLPNAIGVDPPWSQVSYPLLSVKLQEAPCIAALAARDRFGVAPEPDRAVIGYKRQSAQDTPGECRVHLRVPPCAIEPRRGGCAVIASAGPDDTRRVLKQYGWGIHQAIAPIVLQPVVAQVGNRSPIFR